MPSYTTADIRNVLLVGHGGCGKTTLADALLLASGTATRKASVTDGSSFSDFEKEEKEHKHSIYSSILHLDYKGKRINLIDSPGSTDLIGAGARFRVRRCLHPWRGGLVLARFRGRSILPVTPNY